MATEQNFRVERTTKYVTATTYDLVATLIDDKIYIYLNVQKDTR